MKAMHPILLGLPLFALGACTDRVTPVPVIVADAMHMASTGVAPGETPIVRQVFDTDLSADSGIERCAEAAVVAVPGQLVEVGLKRDTATRIWEFGVRQVNGDRYDLECDERSSTIIAKLQRLPSADDVRFAEAARIDPATARQHALDARAGRIEAVHHELREDGQPLYRYSVVAADAQVYRITIDGVSGAVLDAAPSVLAIGAR